MSLSDAMASMMTTPPGSDVPDARPGGKVQAWAEEPRAAHPWPNTRPAQIQRRRTTKYALDDIDVSKLSIGMAVAESGLRCAPSPLIGFKKEPHRLRVGLQRSQSAGGEAYDDYDEAIASIAGPTTATSTPTLATTATTTAVTSVITPATTTTATTTTATTTTATTTAFTSIITTATVGTSETTSVANPAIVSAEASRRRFKIPRRDPKRRRLSGYAAALDATAAVGQTSPAASEACQCRDDGMDHPHGCDDPVHPCPICLATEEDTGDHAMCFECGQMFCGSCNHSGKMPANCPTCRADSQSGPEVRVEQLVRLLARSPGRHTPWAQCALGAILFAGVGVAKDVVKAVQMLRLSADAGVVWAQLNLGNVYLNSSESGPVPRNYADAARYYSMAAAQGNRRARFCLAMMYLQSKGFVNKSKTTLRDL